MTLMRIQYRRGTAADWSAVNPVLADGEPGYEKDTGKRKIGDGSTAWNDLGYATGDVDMDTVYQTDDFKTNAATAATGSNVFAPAVLSTLYRLGSTSNMMVNGDLTIEAPTSAFASGRFGYTDPDPSAIHDDGARVYAEYSGGNDTSVYSPSLDDALYAKSAQAGRTYMFCTDYWWDSPNDPASNGSVHIRTRGSNIGNQRVESWSLDSLDKQTWHRLVAYYTIGSAEAGTLSNHPTVYHSSTGETHRFANMGIYDVGAGVPSQNQLDAALNDLQSTKASVDTLVQSVAVPVAISSGSVSTTLPWDTTVSVWAAPFDATIVSADIVFDRASVASLSDTDYVTVTLVRRDSSGTENRIVSKDTTTLNGAVITAGQTWTFDPNEWDTNYQDLDKGDVLAVKASKTGTFDELDLPMTVVFRYRHQ